ncbi:MAG: PQQ-binding-like beta-propeller repeat protein [Thermoanaerobaculia bacterium]
MKSTRWLLATVLALALIPATAVSASSTWPHLRGPGMDGRVSSELDLGEAPALELAWKVPLGSGYSGIAVADGRAVTSFSDGTSDVVAAFDLTTGREIWRHAHDSVNKARDGSDDGPLSTPLLAQGHAFVVGAKGELVALRLEDGALTWSRALEEDFGSEMPHFGFSTTPILAEGKLIVMTGGSEGRAISALDPKTGETLWSQGSEKVDDQMPMAMELAGRLQIIAVTGKKLQGRSPEDGSVLWTHEFGEQDWVGSSTPTYAGPNQFLIFANGEAVVFGVGITDGEYAVSELYRSKTLGNGYALPVYREGYLYGFRGQVLSCMNAGNGERVWRSRPPGGRGLILVDDKLVVFGANGMVVVADASPDGYRERARIEALASSAYTWPAFADGKVLVRNLEEMAAVRLAGAVRSAMPRRAADEANGHAFGRWLTALVAAEDKAAVAAKYLEENPRWPMLEANYAHFVYTGDVEDLAIRGTMLPNANPVALEAVKGTDLRYLTVEVEPGARYEYQFVKDFGERIPDPRNPDQVPSSGGPPNSQFTTTGYEFPAHTNTPETAARGRIEDTGFESETLGKRELKVYLPPGYDDSTESYPLLLVHDGLNWLEKGLMANSLDNLVGERVQPVVVAFLKPRDEWWLEAGGTGTDQHVDMVVNELLPYIAERYRLVDSPASHAVMGHRGYGLTSAYLALTNPNVFGKAAIQSPQIGLGYEDAFRALLSTEAGNLITFYLDWNRREARDIDAGFDLQQESRAFADALLANEIAFTGGERNDSFGWAGWRTRTDRILETLFPLGK